MSISKNPGISGRNILLTGAGGSIGSALAETILMSDPRLLILLDHSEGNLYEVDTNLNGLREGVDRISMIGDVCDRELLMEIFERYQPEIILHAAAFKHVPLMERNPIAAVRTNALGTNTLARAAERFGVERLVMVSTDKAVNPRSVMGASKRVAEFALLRWTSTKSHMRAVRLGNVLGSQGSVVPTFERQISAGGPVTVTHPDVSRYFLTMNNAVDLILAALSLEGEAQIFIPDIGEPVRIMDLAKQVIEEAGFCSESEIPIVVTDLRPGDKMSEDFLGDNESASQTNDHRLFAVNTPAIPREEFDSLMEGLAGAVDRRNLHTIIESLRKLVPEFRPSESILQLLSDPSALQI